MKTFLGFALVLSALCMAGCGGESAALKTLGHGDVSLRWLEMTGGELTGQRFGVLAFHACGQQ